MLNFIIGAITLLLGILVGYSLGKGSSIIPEETRKQVKRLVQALPIDRGLGAIQRPSAHDIENFNNPIKQAEEEAMSKTFSEIIPKQ
jgi:hypothetical protein